MTLNHPAPLHDSTDRGDAGHGGVCTVILGGEHRRAVILRRAAGTPAAIRHSRRGSFLVLVIGILALISAFMIIYVAVGRSDQQLSSAVDRSAVGLEDNPAGDFGESASNAVAEKFAKYASKVIGDDALSTFYVNKNLPAIRADNGQTVSGTIRLTREASDFPYTDWNRRSDAGADNPDKYFSASGSFDQFTLTNTAALPESWVPSDPWLASTEPVWMNHDAVVNTTPADIRNEFLLRRDWQQVSNFAPDGAFVNLYNLRKATVDTYLGNFEADHAQMQAGKTLTTATGTATNSTDFGIGVDQFVPAHFTMRQRHAAVPVGAFDGNPAAVSYRPYQWADADGDGIYDSRWFEMVDARQEDGSYDITRPRDVLGINGGEYRYFFAARAVDLSALVNVNTATDFVSGPTDSGDYGPGTSPAEVDLRRLLGMQDVWKEFGFAYDALAQTDNTADDGRPQNYFTYNNTTNPILTSMVGNRAYLSLGWTLDKGTIARLTDVNAPIDRQRFGKSDGSDALGGQDGSKLRSEYYQRIGASVDGLSRDFTNQNQLIAKKPFGTPDLVELLTYRGLNDPSYTSSLESAVGGHYGGPTAAENDPLYLRFSPLRDNRPLDIERLDSPGGAMTTQRERQIYAALASDVRQRLTTLSGARPIRTSDLPAIYDEERKQYVPASEELQATELKTLAGSAQATSTIRAYARGLVPYASVRDAWPASTGTFDQYRFLNYGYQSPEIGLRMAAHLAANLQAMRGNAAGEPVVVTVPLWASMTNLIKDDGVAPNGDPTPWPSRTYKWSAWPKTDGRGDLGYENLSVNAADNAGDQLGSDAINVYAVQPHPFISSVASYAIYTDAKDTPDAPDNEPYQPTFPSGAPAVQIRGARDASNGDYIGEVFAIQLVNPFPTAVTLGGDIPADNTGANRAVWDKKRVRYDYYIEYAGRYYRLAGWTNNLNADPSDDGPVSMTLSAGEARTFFFTSLPITTIIDRLNDSQDDGETDVQNITPPPGGDREGVFKKWLNKQIGGIAPHNDPYFMEQFDPKTGQPIPLDSATVKDITSLDGANPTGSTAVVRLWRAVRESYNPVLGTDNESWDPALDSDVGTIPPLPEQNLENDMLVDRFRDPENGGTWRHELDPDWNSVSGTAGWDYTSDNTDSDSNDNRPSGMTFTLGGVVARSGDPDGQKLERTGLLPAYCMESGFGGALINTAVKSYDVDGSGYAQLKESMLDGTDRTGGRVLNQDSDFGSSSNESWYHSQTDGGVEIFHTMVEAPSRWNVIGTDVTRTSAAEIGGDLRANRPLLWAASAGAQRRLTDVLLPLAIGAQFSFRMADNAPVSAAELDERWLTESESWSLALGYDRTASLLPSSPRWGIYENFGGNAPASTPRIFPATDAGRIVLSSAFSDWNAPSATNQTLSPFIPFVDLNTNGVFDNAGAGGNEALSLGITPAAAILEQFTVSSVTPSLTRAQLGTVNLATAPLAVLRVLPMLSPTTDPMTGYGWWWTDTDQSGNHSKLDDDTDLAATIAAYRDKSQVRTRPDGTSATTRVVAFDDRDTGGAPLGDLRDPQDWNGRSGRALALGLREQPGLMVAGEILSAARRVDLPSGGAVVPPSDPSNIDFLGMDVETTVTNSRINTTNKKGITSLDYTEMTPVKDDYEIFEERLIVPGAVLGSATTRSDYFAVWFTVAGFRQADVRGLSNTMPLVPSMQRRYVMVVDRSNVVKKGDKPRIVFFREVPIR